MKKLLAEIDQCIFKLAYDQKIRAIADALANNDHSSWEEMAFYLHNEFGIPHEKATKLCEAYQKKFGPSPLVPEKDLFPLVKKYASMELKFYSDPGHGWLEVPEKVYKDSGIAASHYSYYDKRKKMVYLEEDSDAPKFEKAMKEKGLAFKVHHVSSDSDSPIRSLSRMPGY